MNRNTSNPRYNRRKILKWTGLATGAAVLPSASYMLQAFVVAARAKYFDAKSVIPLPKHNGTSTVVLLRSEDRVVGTRRAIDLLQPQNIRGKTIFLKPNCNTADPAPGATDTKLLEALVQELQNAGAGQITLGDRSGMADTRQAMQAKGWFELAERHGLQTLVLDEMKVDQWQYFAAEGTHWKQGFAFARPALNAGAVVSTCCLKTHGGIGSFTLSLKNSVGLVAKKVPGDRFNYMNDLHTSRHIQRMVAEINAVYQPAFVLMDGVEAFIKGGPATGDKVPANVILAATDRVALDVVALGILRSLGTSAVGTQGSVWQLEQIRRAVELGLGAGHPDQIQIVTADGASQKLADQIRPFLAI
jgi:uncharacterized protein (DUF362 family)